MSRSGRKPGARGAAARFAAFRPDERLLVVRLLRLSLIQAAAGMTLVLLDGALNRILIVEMHVSAILVTLMIGAPLVFAPLRAVIGFRSDVHASSLGWRRTPYLVMGAMVQFGGLAIMPFFLLAMTSHAGPAGAVGEAGAMLSFLMAGVGLYTTQTTGLALAADLAPENSRLRVVGLMFVALFCGMILSALVFRFALQPYTPMRLIRVIQSAAMLVAVLTGVAIWRQEPFGGGVSVAPAVRRPSFAEALAPILGAPRAVRTLVMLALGSAAFGLQEVLVEPFGGQVLHMSVGSTTALTGLVGAGSLVGFFVATRRSPQGADSYRLTAFGALAGILAFVAVILAAPLGSRLLLQVGMAGVGFSAGLFGVAALNATLALAPSGQAGLALGVWGSVQALGAGVAVAGGGALRVLLSHLAQNGRLGADIASAEIGYIVMYHLAIALLFGALVAVGPLVGQAWRSPAPISDGEKTTPEFSAAMG